jgi:hypothetical protein
MHRLPTCELVKRKHGSDTKIQRHNKWTKTKTEGPDAKLARAHAHFIHHLRVVTDRLRRGGKSKVGQRLCFNLHVFQFVSHRAELNP